MRLLDPSIRPSRRMEAYSPPQAAHGPLRPARRALAAETSRLQQGDSLPCRLRPACRDASSRIEALDCALHLRLAQIGASQSTFDVRPQSCCDKTHCTRYTTAKQPARGFTQQISKHCPQQHCKHAPNAARPAHLCARSPCPAARAAAPPDETRYNDEVGRAHRPGEGRQHLPEE